MKFICEKCKTKYSIAEEKVRGKVLKIRCKNCSNIIVVRETRKGTGERKAVDVESTEGSLGEAFDGLLRDKPAASRGGPALKLAPAPSPLERQDSDSGFVESRTYLTEPPDFPAGEEPPAEWYLAVEGTQFGPMTFVELCARVKRGEAGPEAFVWRESYEDWKELGAVKELKPFIPKLPPPPPKGRSGLLSLVKPQSAPTERAPETLAPEGPAPAPPPSVKVAPPPSEATFSEVSALAAEALRDRAQPPSLTAARGPAAEPKPLFPDEVRSPAAAPSAPSGAKAQEPLFPEDTTPSPTLDRLIDLLPPISPPSKPAEVAKDAAPRVEKAETVEARARADRLAELALPPLASPGPAVVKEAVPAKETVAPAPPKAPADESPLMSEPTLASLLPSFPSGTADAPSLASLVPQAAPTVPAAPTAPSLASLVPQAAPTVPAASSVPGPAAPVAAAPPLAVPSAPVPVPAPTSPAAPAAGLPVPGPAPVAPVAPPQPGTPLMMKLAAAGGLVAALTGLVLVVYFLFIDRPPGPNTGPAAMVSSGTAAPPSRSGSVIPEEEKNEEASLEFEAESITRTRASERAVKQGPSKRNGNGDKKPDEPKLTDEQRRLMALMSEGKDSPSAAAPAAPIPTATARPSQPQRPVSPNELGRLQQIHKDALHSCYTRALKRDESLSELKAEFEVTIGDTGIVRSVEVQAGGNADLQICFTRVVKRWVFPSVGAQTVRFSILLRGS